MTHAAPSRLESTAPLAGAFSLRPEPFTGLTPDVALDALACAGWRGDGRILQLNSYENRVLLVHLEDGSAIVAKFYRPGRWNNEQILEEHAFALELAQEDVPVAPPLPLSIDEHGRWDTALHGDVPTLATVHTDSGPWRFAVFRRLAGRAPELEQPDVLRCIGRFIARIHQVGARRPYTHRRSLTIDTYGHGAVHTLRELGAVPLEAEANYFDVAQRVLDACTIAFDRVGPWPGLRLHGDSHPGNVLWSNDSAQFVDLDDSVYGPAVQDLWMLLPGDPQNTGWAKRHLLEGYETFLDFDDRQWALVEALRSLRLIHHSAWLASRWEDPAFAQAFPWFSEPAYWAQQTTTLREQLAAMS